MEGGGARKWAELGQQQQLQHAPISDGTQWGRSLQHLQQLKKRERQQRQLIMKEVRAGASDQSLCDWKLDNMYRFMQ